MLGVGKRRGGMVLGLQRGETGTRVFLRLQVRFRSGNGRLRRIVFRRTAGSCTGGGGGHNRLARVAHFLHRWPYSATQQTDDTDQNNHEP